MTDQKTEIQKTSGSKLIATMATKYGLDPKVFFDTLKATILKPVKGKDGKYREATNEELASFLVVANKYNLDPFTKEIYAFVDKSGGIVPVVSTDGWNRLMTSHENYKAHDYTLPPVSEWVETEGGKSCPAWMQINIHKKDGGVVVVTEYLDECFRKLDYQNPWMSHTKRMLRHKTKIQGAREAFGFSGIYDEDEAARIVEATVTATPAIEMPKPKKEIAAPTVPDKNPEAETFATDKQVANLIKLAAEVGLKDEDGSLFDFLTAMAVKNPDKPTVSEYQACIKEIGRKMDEKAKKGNGEAAA